MGLESATYLNDLVVANPLFNDGKAQGDDHIRLIKTVLLATFPGMSGAMNRVQSKSSGYMVVANDNTSLFSATTALTLQITAAATLGNKHFFAVDASGGDVTLDPSGAELINGVGTFVVPKGYIGLVWCDGAAFTCGLIGKSTQSVQTVTGNITFTATDVAGQKEVTAAADLTLPAASAALVGTKMLVHSSTTGKVRVVPNGANTIEGLAQAYRVPSWVTLELMCISATGWILLRAPQHFVGQLVPCAVAQTIPGFLPADFTAVSRTTYGGLFDLISTLHGVGDGSTTFNVPDTRGRVVVGAGTGEYAEAVNASAVSSGNDTFDVALNTDTWVTGMKVQLTTTGGLPAGLALATDYWVIRGSTTTIRFATTLANAQNGVTIDITTQGTGIHTVTHALSARAVGLRGGEQAHAMSSTELLLHQHDNIGQANISGAPNYPTLMGNSLTINTPVAAKGGNVAMNTMQPFGVAQFYIKT